MAYVNVNNIHIIALQGAVKPGFGFRSDFPVQTETAQIDKHSGFQQVLG
jgi:hypothetical protein